MTNKRLPPGLEPADRLIVALDFDTAAAANRLVEQLDGLVGFYKVGWQLFLGEGWPFVAALLESGRRVFLDLKINDIDQTVKMALTNLPDKFTGALELLTISGTGATAAAARAGRGDCAKPYLLMLTLLSSMDESDLAALYPGQRPPDMDTVIRLRAQAALDAGCEGLIASGRSVRALREQFSAREFLIVTPGIRPRDTGADEHKRSLTPYQAMLDGSDYLVVGRPVSRAADPRAVARAIITEMQAALAER